MYVGGGTDYDSGPYNATFTAGETIASFFVTIIDDGIREDDEDFTLIINSSLIPINVPDQAIVTIIDDDGKYIIVININ